MNQENFPDPGDFATSSSFKEAVYRRIDEGIPGWMFDLKLEIVWRKANEKNLEPYMEEVIQHEA